MSKSRPKKVPPPVTHCQSIGGIQGTCKLSNYTCCHTDAETDLQRGLGTARALAACPQHSPTPGGIPHFIPFQLSLLQPPALAHCAPASLACLMGLRYSKLALASSPLHLLFLLLRTLFLVESTLIHSLIPHFIHPGLCSHVPSQRGLQNHSKIASPPSLQSSCPASVYFITLIPPRYQSTCLLIFFVSVSPAQM